VGEKLIADLTVLLEKGVLEKDVAELTATIDGDLVTVIDPTNPDAITDFLSDLEEFSGSLPDLGDGAVLEIATESGELITLAIEDVVACLTAPGGEEPEENEQPAPTATYYEDCDDARAQGAAPVLAGQPGYRAGLDSDDDGVGCEDSTPTVAPVAVTTLPTHAGTLAYTGFELGPQLAAGGVLLLLGGGLLTASRRRA
jgi:hypothetical protein